ncbi:hypothetical protein ABZ307_40775 [Streptomyces griseorubiginosus]|uniref:hypothetical protein n=1 Tax=Streptomyces griseorubiginosus TaxID=67304 RepID=UPI0033A3D506
MPVGPAYRDRMQRSVGDLDVLVHGAAQELRCSASERPCSMYRVRGAGRGPYESADVVFFLLGSPGGFVSRNRVSVPAGITVGTRVVPDR